MSESSPPDITKSRLVKDFTDLGVQDGDVLMLHASVKSVGWIVGGPDVILQALLDVIGPDGTLMMYVGWADGTYEMSSWAEEKQRAYLEECPPFDPKTSRAVVDWSILTEFLRTTPGAHRSANPEASMAAVGAKAEWITADHPLNYGFGPGSPLDKLCQANGKVLLLGSPFDAVTLLHYAEALANVPNKRTVNYRQPILQDGATVWIEVEEFDSSEGIREWAGSDTFECIVREFLAAGRGGTGRVGAAESRLLDARELVAFGVAWLERTFGPECNAP
jgi:aminoglycoside 3-N-acetyltransferase